MNQSPNQMRAVVFEEKGKFPVFKMIDIPQPLSGQVLIKMDSAPINPSDLSFLKGTYNSNKPYPNVPGFEGSGTVVLNGGGLLGWSLVGKRVAVVSQTQFGTYGEYCIADSSNCFELDGDATFQQGSCTFVNPLTVIAMLDITKQLKSPCVVNTAAASALGRMMVRYFKTNGVKVINIVRRKEQVDILKSEGAEFIIDQSDPEYLGYLKELALSQQATVFFDAIGGDLTGKILENLPYGTKCYVYGGLSLQNVGQIPITDLIFQKKSVEGFWLTDWLKNRNILSQAFFIHKLRGLIKQELKTHIAKEEAVEFYRNNMSAGKVLLRAALKPGQHIGPQEFEQQQKNEEKQEIQQDLLKQEENQVDKIEEVLQKEQQPEEK